MLGVHAGVVIAAWPAGRAATPEAAAVVQGLGFASWTEHTRYVRQLVWINIYIWQELRNNESEGSPDSADFIPNHSPEAFRNQPSNPLRIPPREASEIRIKNFGS